MEKITCGIIQDLLPSYGDGLTGESVTDMLSEHLTECELCRQRYEELKRKQEAVDRAEASKGQSFGAKLKSIKYYAIGFAIGLTMPVLLLVLWYIVAMIKDYIYWMVFY